MEGLTAELKQQTKNLNEYGSTVINRPQGATINSKKYHI